MTCKCDIKITPYEEKVEPASKYMENQTDVAAVNNDQTGKYWGYGISAVIIIAAVAVIVYFEVFNKKGVVMHYKKENKEKFEKYKEKLEKEKKAKEDQESASKSVQEASPA